MENTQFYWYNFMFLKMYMNLLSPQEDFLTFHNSDLSFRKQNVWMVGCVLRPIDSKVI